MKILAITQARIGSTRLPEKILKTINGETLLEIHLKRILKSKLITKLKIATTTEPGVEKITSIASKLGLEVYQGSINNVLERFYETAAPENPSWVVRLTSDCPLIDPEIIDQVIQYAIDNNLDYVSNTLNPTYPDGLDVEVFKFTALEKAKKEAVLTSELEHVTPYIWKNSTFEGGSLFNSGCVSNETDYSELRITVDTNEDFDLIKNLVEQLGTDQSWIKYVEILLEHSEIKKLNEKYSRNEGYEKSIKND
jgi:spore coat polysaccharide biosynthesis protein SpsF